MADKPHFLPVTPSGRYVQQTPLTRQKRRTGIDTLTPVHRLERDYRAPLRPLARSVGFADQLFGQWWRFESARELAYEAGGTALDP